MTCLGRYEKRKLGQKRLKWGRPNLKGENMVKEKDELVVDFTDSKELGPLEAAIPYVGIISKWAYGKGPTSEKAPEGDPKVDVTVDVVMPEGVNAKVFDSINLRNENTKSRAVNILAATGAYGTKEEILKNKNFRMPAATKMLGLRLGFWTRVQQDKTGKYPDKSVITRTFREEDYEGILNPKA